MKPNDGLPSPKVRELLRQASQLHDKDQREAAIDKAIDEAIKEGYALPRDTTRSERHLTDITRGDPDNDYLKKYPYAPR